MDVDEAVRGARLLASDIERSLGVTVEISTEYQGSWPTLRDLLGRPEPSGWVRISVPEAGTSAALDPTEPGSVTAEGFAMELAQIIQGDIQMHLREPWPRDPAASRTTDLKPTERGWQSHADTSYLVPYGRLGSTSADE
ncbi:hypothetical protein [Nocardia sp. NBC_00416]|uniref:hypothetical protein n=1 Tax=Nocardia sp. NBC_00416 TaxID=2975991 RepID=UPI002E1CC8EC